MPAALASLAIMLCTAYALVTGLSYGVMTQGREALISVFVAPPKPPPPPQEKRKVVRASSPAPKGAPSPPNLKNKATAVFAPKLPPIVVPPPIVTAPLPAQGNAAQTGASDRLGPGQGAGGIGDGTGGGGQGGEGDGGGIASGPRQIRGKLSFRDLPEGLLAPGGEASVGVRYAVEPDGSVTGCRADEPSGYPAIDALACRLIEQRFRFRPAKNRAGRPVRSIVVERHSWFIRPDDRG